jgi:NDP-sugar pyrophosphorylase family protein
MAAGMGRRYGGLKQIEPITAAGEIIIDFSLYDAYEAGFRRAVFVIKREMEPDVRRLIEGRSDGRFEISYVFQTANEMPDSTPLKFRREKPWGTGHAVWCARNTIDAPFAVINADDYYGPEAFRVIYDFLKRSEPGNNSFAMVSYLLGNTLTDNGAVTRGVCEIRADGFLKSVTERKKIIRRGGTAFYEDGGEWIALADDTPVSMNFWGFKPAIFRELERRFPEFAVEALRGGVIGDAEFLLPTAVNDMLNGGCADVHAFPCRGRWHGVTFPEDKAAVSGALEALKRDGVYPMRLWG